MDPTTPSLSRVTDLTRQRTQAINPHDSDGKTEADDKICGLILEKLQYLILGSDEETRVNTTNHFALYIGPAARVYKDSGNSTPFDLNSRLKSFIHNNGDYTKRPKKYLLLLAEGGSGKTMFCQKLALELIESHRSGDRIPLYIPLNIIEQPSTHLMESYFKEISLTLHQIDWLKRQPVLIILDAYDEARQAEPNNLYNHNGFNEWTSVKFITTTRPSHLEKELNYKTLFIPAAILSGADLFEEFYLLPFNPEQRNSYVVQYIKEKEGLLIGPNQRWSEAATYLSYFNQISGLEELTRTPLFLWITMDVLPDIAAEFDRSRDEDNIVYTKRKLLIVFMEHWFAREENKLLYQRKISEGETIIPKYQQFCEKLAYMMGLELNGKGVYSVSWPMTVSASANEEEKKRVAEHNAKWQEMFDDTQTLIRKGAPLKRIGPTEKGFIHNEIQAYFNVQHSTASTRFLSHKPSESADDEVKTPNTNSAVAPLTLYTGLGSRISTTASLPKVLIDIVILTVKETEFLAVFKLLEPLIDQSKIIRCLIENSMYYFGRYGLYNAALLASYTAGVEKALHSLGDAIRLLKPQLAVNVGIAWGANPEKTKLGDVLVADRVVNLDDVKITPDQTITRSAMPRIDDRTETIVHECKRLWNFPNLDGDPCQVHIGLYLGSNTLLNNPQLKANFLTRHPEAIGGEMESYAVYAAASRYRIPWIVVKGISDWGDGTKSKTDQYHALAAASAASFLHTICKEIPNLVQTAGPV